jgi:hypothetical protein
VPIIKKKHESSIVSDEPTSPLTVTEARDWLMDLPPDAKLQAIQRDIGSQRDPWLVTVGLRAAWEE